ncbi:hypothetical protein HDU98_006007 [Podochytrium sp. JEL0797]|nr:hypothetical protein HDU98_006007 [Podochytrium sp. JEL0797]
MTIRPVTEADAEAITAIYNHYIRDTIITFEEDEVSVDEIRSRIRTIVASGFPYVVWQDPVSSHILGYAYTSTFRTRNAFRFTTESTIYLAHDAKVMNQGIGTKLYEALITECRARKFHAILGVVSLPNDSSARLHEKLGFVKCGHLRDSGFKFGKWVDVGIWELIL